MNAAKQFYAQNSGLVQNVIYILALLLVLNLVYTYLTAGSDIERYVIQINMANGVYGVPGNASSALVPAGSNLATKTQFLLNYDDSITDPGFIPNPLIRITEGADFSISWWMYISTWDNAKMGVIKPIITISDDTLSTTGNSNAAYIMVAFLYPSTNMLGIRFHTRGVDANELTWMQNFLTNATSAATAQQTLTTAAGIPVCDINDIDMQRWLNITCVVSGRVLDVYYDGKLNRSCVLPGNVVGTPAGSGKQYINSSIGGGFNGFLNGVFFSASALTPDRIYGLYQSGPQGTTSIIRALFSKLGINLNYNGTGNWANYL